MKLDIDRQEHGRSELEISGSVALNLGAGRPELAQVQGCLTVDNLENRFLLTGALQASGKAQCGRCLAEFMLVWEVPVEIMVLRNQDSDEGEGDTLVLHQTRGEVDLEPAIGECLALAYPLATFCKEDCKGLCPTCGIDLNSESCSCQDDEIDPRWAALDDI